MSSVGKKKNFRKVQMASCTIVATFNNTIVSICDLAGNTLSWSSCGKCGFKGSRKSTPYAASVAAKNAAEIAFNTFGVRSMSVSLRGPGAGRESSVRALQEFFKITVLIDNTGVPHNGCRPPKRRCV